MTPFTRGTIWILIVGLSVYLLSILLPNLNNPFLNILVKGGIISVLYIPTIFALKISTEYNQLILKTLEKFGIKF